MLSSRNVVFGILVGSASLLFGCNDDNDSIGSAPEVIAVNGGDLTETALSTLAFRPDAPASASALVAPSTMLISATGAVLDPSSVLIQVQAFDGSPAAQREFDGGLTFLDPGLIAPLAFALGSNVSAVRTATIELAGYARITVTAAGEAVKQFSPPITVEIKTPGYAAGKLMAIISVDEATHERRYEGTALVDDAGKVSFSIDHLTVLAAIASVKNTTGVILSAANNP